MESCIGTAPVASVQQRWAAAPWSSFYEKQQSKYDRQNEVSLSEGLFPGEKVNCEKLKGARTAVRGQTLILIFLFGATWEGRITDGMKDAAGGRCEFKWIFEFWNNELYFIYSDLAQLIHHQSTQKNMERSVKLLQQYVVMNVLPCDAWGIRIMPKAKPKALLLSDRVFITENNRISRTAIYRLLALFVL